MYLMMTIKKEYRGNDDKLILMKQLLEWVGVDQFKDEFCLYWILHRKSVLLTMMQKKTMQITITMQKITIM